MRRLSRLSLGCGLLILLIVVFYFCQPAGYYVVVKDNPEYQETTYTIIVDNKDWYRLITAQTELNKEVMAYGSNTVGIKPQLAPLKALLLKLRKKEGKLRPTLLWQTTKGYPEFFVRVGEAVQPYPAELKRRRPNELMLKIANEIPAYPELKLLFSGLGYSIEVSSVEKVAINRTKELPPDFMLWFRLKEAGGERR